MIISVFYIQVDQMRKYSLRFHTPPDLPVIFIHTTPVNSVFTKEAMGDLFVLLLLLSVQTTKANSHESICNENTEYLKDGTDLCCKKCQPGYHLGEHCSENKETVCEPCKSNTYLENWNYAQNCFSCKICNPRKLLRYKQNCTLTKNAVCVCEPETFCAILLEPECSACKRYRKCPPGQGVSVQGTPSSDVKCQKCPNGTFSSISSNSEKCKPHTDCKGRAIVKKGDAISDNICEDEAPKPLKRATPRAPVVIVLTSTEANNPGTTIDFTTTQGVKGFTQTSNTFVSFESSSSTKSPHTTKQPDIKPVVIASSVVGIFFLLLTFVSLLFFYKRRRTDSAKLHPKVDANGNCENGGKIVQSHEVERQKMGLTSEQQCLLGKSEAGSEDSQCSNSSDTSTKPDNFISNEPSTLLSKSDFNNPIFALSEPMTLLSNPEAVTPQPSIPAQPSSQPTSPQIISPVTDRPHVNVNITVHIGNGSYQTVNPIDTKQAECQLPFEEEDWSVSTPKQEEGEQTCESVPESGANSTYYIPK
uniref:TNFR-Cys domain-containing protein n=2 Tax=Oryzias latipes TaxID=8090 RepID=A0A3P9LEN5_ORYLA